jgi:hypothetical protein
MIVIAAVMVIAGGGVLLLSANGQIPWLIAAAWFAIGALGAAYYLRRHVIRLQLRGDQVEVVTGMGTRVGPVTDVTVIRTRVLRPWWVDMRFQHRTWSMVGSQWGLFNDDPRDAADALQEANPRLKRI